MQVTDKIAILMPTKLKKTGPTGVINPLYTESDGQSVVSLRQTVKI